MSQVTHLASGALTRSGDPLSIELHQPLDTPAVVMVIWPAKPTVTAPTPKTLAALAAAMVRSWRRRRRNSPRSGLDSSHRIARADRAFRTCAASPWSARQHEANRYSCPTVHKHRPNNRGHHTLRHE